MNTNNEGDWKQRMLELEEKNKYYKLKRREKEKGRRNEETKKINIRTSKGI